MDDPYVQAVYGLFVNRTGAYLAADRRSNTWFWRHEPLSIPLVQAAVHGRVSLGIASVSGTGTSKHLVLDADSAADLPVLYRLAARLAPQGNVLLEQSRRGGHLFMFGPPTDWRVVHAYGHQLVADAGLSATEVYPKSEGLHGIKLPGSVHPRSLRVYPAINPLTGEVMDVRKALLAVKPQPFPEMELRHELPMDQFRDTTNMIDRRDAHGFQELVDALSRLTTLRVYGEDKASGRCPFHPDRTPSLYVKGNRFHCLSSRCGRFGDIQDVRRYLRAGVLPPHG